MMTNSKYSLALRITHWLMAVLLAFMIVSGLLMTRSLEGWQLNVLGLHKAVGFVVLGLFCLRVAFKFIHPANRASRNEPGWKNKVADIVHGLMYVMMAGIPVTGLMSQYFASRPVSIFGLFHLPVSEQTDIILYSVVRELHGLLAAALIALIVLHLGGVIYHQFIKKDNTLRRMI
ncbi:cytochrome b [Pseudoalteromonas viridis]|uniref:Cytochrome b n=2 Tax=Pseudoalteromonas viridis TaxID=339617 RepID=A0ABX7VCX8_9GAMM|nr:cytochrome b [Pseudoalteromonas viridis]